MICLLQIPEAAKASPASRSWKDSVRPAGTIEGGYDCRDVRDRTTGCFPDVLGSRGGTLPSWIGIGGAMKDKGHSKKAACLIPVRA
jgi:hypothetical protein